MDRQVAQIVEFLRDERNSPWWPQVMAMTHTNKVFSAAFFVWMEEGIKQLNWYANEEVS